MSNKIFLLAEDGSLRPMIEAPYATEDDLQGLLERYPDLLVGDQVHPDAPRRWLLVKREMGIADAADAASRWSLDHLFLDQDGMLTLVEVKRATDTRARREVAAQMLDYAANAVLYWPVEQIIASFEKTATDAGQDPEQVLATFLAGTDGTDVARDAEAFWERVKTNLAAERIRLVFVADSISRELRRIVEFLNDHMDRVHVVALEVKQYVGQNMRTLVPTVVGQTVKSSGKGVARESRVWDADSFREAARARGDAIALATERLIGWFDSNAAGVRYGGGGVATFTGRIIINDESLELVRAHVEDRLSISLFNTPAAYREPLWERLNRISGLKFKRSENSCGTQLSPLADPKVWQEFSGVLGWLVGEITKPQPA